MRSMPSRTITAISYANAGSYARQFGTRRREHVALAVAVLQPLAGERRAAGGRAEQEAAAALVAERPDEVADALEPEHRIEDEERDHRLTPRRVRGAGGGERRHRPGLGDPLLEDAPVARLAVREQQARRRPARSVWPNGA